MLASGMSHGFPSLEDAGAHECDVAAQVVKLIGKRGRHFHLVDSDFVLIQADENGSSE